MCTEVANSGNVESKLDGGTAHGCIGPDTDSHSSHESLVPKNVHMGDELNFGTSSLDDEA